ncbi:MAG: tetratricopeptide repeat protein [Anaerolineae bacterium]
MPRLEQRLGFTRYEADEAYKRALDAYKKADFDTAIDGMTAAIEALPRHAEYYAARGFLYFEDGEEDKARTDYEEAIRLFKYEMLAHYGLGMIAYRRAQKGEDAALWEEALKHFTTAYRIDPNRPETLYYLALVYYHKRDYPNAVRFMLNAQTAFDRTGDKRKVNADKWVREFTRWVDRTRELLNAAGTPTGAPQLPE